MSKIFLSFLTDAKPDEDLAILLKSSIEKKNYDVITSPRENEDKESIKELKDRIKSVDFFIVILSKESIKNSYIQDEIKIANDFFNQSRKRPVIFSIRLGDYDELPTDLAEHLDEKEYIKWTELGKEQIVVEQIIDIITQKTKKQKIKRSTRQFLVDFLKVFGIVLLIFNFTVFLILSLTLIEAGDFIKTNGALAFIYIWGCLPILISFLFSILIYGDNLIEDKIRVKKLRISTSFIVVALLIILGCLSYKDSHKTELIIISENPIYKIKIESKMNNKICYELFPLRVEDSKNFILNKRLPYDDYNITVIFKSEQSQFITRKLKERKETLILF